MAESWKRVARISVKMNYIPSKIDRTIMETEEFIATLKSGKEGNFSKDAARCNCLLSILDLTNWNWNRQALIEALPHYSAELSQEEFCDIMSRLGYRLSEYKGPAKKYKNELRCPALYIDWNGNWFSLVKLSDEYAILFDGGALRRRKLDINSVRGTFYVPHKLTNTEVRALEARELVGVFLRRHKKTLMSALRYSLIANLFALSIPLYVLAVFDSVIPSSSTFMLALISIGGLLALSIEFLARYVRATHLSFFAAKVSQFVNSNVFQFNMETPQNLQAGTSITRKIDKFLDFDRSTLKGAGLHLSQVLDLIFVPIALGFLSILSLPIAAASFIGALIMLLTPVLILSKNSQDEKKTIPGYQRARKVKLLELIVGREYLRDHNSNIGVADEINRISKVINEHVNQRGQSVLSRIAGVMGVQRVLITLVVIFIGVNAVISAELGVGALIAVMALVFRLFASIAGSITGGMALFPMSRILTETGHIARKLDRLAGEAKRGKLMPSGTMGQICLESISCRYPAQSDFSLFNINMQIDQGHAVLVAGESGAGKTTLLKVLLGVVAPVSGKLKFQEFNSRQVLMEEMRKGIGYLPSEPSYFFGTIRQNLLLANPTATEKEIKNACRMSGLNSKISRLSDGVDTLITDSLRQDLSSSFFRKVNLAQVLLRDAGILLFDEPLKGMDREHAEKFLTLVSELRGKKTLIITMRDTELLSSTVDQVVVLQKGRQITEANGQLLLKQ